MPISKPEIEDARGKTSVVGQVARIEVGPSGMFEVSVGRTTLAIDRESASDLCNTLAVALESAGERPVDRLLVLETSEDVRHVN
jgi:hypothetical protein